MSDDRIPVLTDYENKLVTHMKDDIFTHSSLLCLESLTEFNDCREYGMKKDKQIKNITDEEQKYFMVTKGCYDEYKKYYNCVENITVSYLNSNEIKKAFIGPNKIRLSKEIIKLILLKDYKLI